LITIAPKDGIVGSRVRAGAQDTGDFSRPKMLATSTPS
jgi:hypothetical protein